MVELEELKPTDLRTALRWLDAEPVRNLRIIWALRTWGIFNLGLPEQGRYLTAFEDGDLRGLLFLNNLGLLRLSGPPEIGIRLVERALMLWGLPGLLAGPEDMVDSILSRFSSLESAVEHIEEEVSMVLQPEDFKPYGKKASLSLLEDVDELVELERLMQLEMLGSSAAEWVLRSQILRAVEGGVSCLIRHRGRVVGKAEMDATTPAADELGGVFTLPGMRGRGYAKACCSFLCGLSVASGKTVRLETQRDNLPALAVYSELGFRPMWPHLAVRFK